MKLTAAFLSAVLVGQVSAECPNACSGNGNCGMHDMCSCYQNYQGNDCSERTCYFGLAFVDSPKGDLNADGIVSGPLTTVITGSEVYPWGTTEQYPNADANEGHFYMECSNKGLCDRQTGECDCFDGYEGTACIRSTCPNECSGHGTCETIKEIAEWKGYDTNSGDVPTTQPVGSDTSHHNFNIAIEESYSYDLWDADKTVGCKCDAVYYGADCSLRKCKYGVDPLFYDDTDGVIYQTTIVHVGSKGTAANYIEGTFNLVFFDIFGEKYTSKPVAAKTSECTQRKIVEAFQALPNDVISRTNDDVTRVPPDAVTVSMHASVGADTTTSGSIGAGEEGLGVGLGTFRQYGPEFTVTFSTNPGILKTIELDTRQVSNEGTTDYWIANMRQGQFSSRYTDTVGRINTLLYGSKYLYTNEVPAATLGLAANDLVKVGGQEFMVEHVDDNVNTITLNEPFLGSSIIPILTDTGATANAISSAQNAHVLSIGGVTTSNTDTLKVGAKLYMQQEPFTSDAGTLAVGAGSMAIKDSESRYWFNNGAITETIYRRTDNPNNQNFYRVKKDTAVETTDGYCFTRGSPDLYACAQDLGLDMEYTSASTPGTGMADADTHQFTWGTPQQIVNDMGIWIGIHGPFQVHTAADGKVAFGRATDCEDVHDFIHDPNNFFAAPIWYAKTPTETLSPSSTIMLMNGRRYKIQETTTSWMTSTTKIRLTEAYSGQHFMEMCTDCVKTVTHDGQSETSVIVQSTATFDIAKGSFLLVGSNTDMRNGFYTNAEYAGASSDGTTRTITGDHITGSGSVSGTQANNQALALYKATSMNGYNPILITESATQVTYQYVSQCSNRGTCDSSSGLCTCFKGYTSDNCDTQNMLAM